MLEHRVQKVVRTYSWWPKDQQEVNRLIDDGWQLVQVSTEEHSSCHATGIGGTQTVYFRLEKML